MLQITNPASRRQGIVLLVVITMLSLFAVVALGFLFYAESSATASRYTLESQSQVQADIDPEGLFNYSMGILLFGKDNTAGANPFGGTNYTNNSCVIKDECLATLLYGYDPNKLSYIPYAGAGSVTYTAPDAANQFLAAMTADGKILKSSFADPKFRPAGMAPLANGGDVKNVDWSPGTLNPTGGFFNNDSSWLNLGYPVMTSVSGKRYIPLFAPLIIDMEGKVNISAAGNIRGRVTADDQFGAARVHASNMGLWASEINVGKVLDNDATEWINLYLGNGSVNGRYGMGQDKVTGKRYPRFEDLFITGGPANPPPFFGIGDLEGTRGSGGDAATKYLASQKMLLPSDAGNGNPPHYPFPFFDVNNKVAPPAYDSYGNGDLYERTGHPSLFNPFNPNAYAFIDANNPATKDRVFDPYHLEALYRYGGTGSPALRSDLFRLCPTNLDPKNDPTGKRKRLITTTGWDLGRPGLLPALPEFAQPFDDPTLTLLMRRLNLQRSLSDYYKNFDVAKGRLDPVQFQKATQERQAFATDIYNLLRLVAMGNRPTTLGQPTPAPDPVIDAANYAIARNLAQLAVNMVDFIDTDDISTPFNWDPSDKTATAFNSAWVYGTELPRIVMNEVYSEASIDATDPTKIRFDTWIEFLNPFKADPNLADRIKPVDDVQAAMPKTDGAARLQSEIAGQAKYAMYKVLILGEDFDPADFNGTTGSPTDPTKVKIDITDFTPDPAFTPKCEHRLVLAADVAYGDLAANNELNNGFYVLGPVIDFPQAAVGADVPPRATLRVKDDGAKNTMTYKRALIGTDLTTVKNNILLQRLACPYMDWDSDPTKATYNPYITVDYLVNLPIQNAVKTDLGYVPMEEGRKAQGRKQPYTAEATQIVDQAPGKKGIPQQTFFRHNGLTDTAPAAPGDATLTLPFDWLVHLDRNMASPIELMHVSKYAPHWLTQKFIDAAGKKNQQNENWYADPTGKLYRFLEFVDAGYRFTDISVEGRTPGKININSIWDREVFRALCDAQASSSFTGADVDTLFAALLDSRNPTKDPTTGLNIPDASSKPFQSLAASIDLTLLRKDAAGRQLFELATQTHPFRQKELLSKIFNNTTTRSNVFAVYLTVGFFEVNENPATGTYTIGNEIGKLEGRQIRHRMFAIVDRTEIKLFNTNVATAIAMGPQTVTPKSMSGPADNGRNYTIQKGMMLTVKSGEGVEDVLVTDVAATTFTATFLRNHTTNITITARGNPGPTPGYNARKDTGVVPYFSIIR